MNSRKRSRNVFSLEATSVKEAVVILCQFPDMATGAEHPLELKMPPLDTLQQKDITCIL